VVAQNRPMYCILLGAPGAGKGTQAALLSHELGLPRISSGDLFREHIRAKTDLGREAKQYLDRGELVPDSLTVAMCLQRLGRKDCARGAILDGFPRTRGQAEALDAALAMSGRSIHRVINLTVGEEALLERLSGRWMCPSCGGSFHSAFHPPKRHGKCDDCDGELYQREDDCAETVAHRLQVYFRQTSPLQRFYRDRGLLVEVDGEQPIEDVRKAMHRVLRLMESVAA
jgi:adenylate kinase